MFTRTWFKYRRHLTLLQNAQGEVVMRHRIMIVRLAGAAVLAFGLMANPVMVRAQAFSCSSFSQIAGNFSGVGVGAGQGVPVSTFTFVAINNVGQIAVFTYGSAFGLNQAGAPAGVSGVTVFSTGTVQIVTPSTCMLTGTLTGIPGSFVAKVANGGDTILISTPFDSTEQTLGIFWRD